ncbi:hypothetical protein JX266_008547 [Neoarthrinium moseri]|nr:hypothetical protein JX266_008547 [Neoarthrinium moseri]
MTGNLTSTGRGGAGNIGDVSKSPRIEPKDLQTPTLKTPVVTTGRGGSGNMTPNRDPAETRALQDVGPVTRRPSEGATHVGRGGAANVAKLSAAEIEKAKQSGSAVEDEPAGKKDAKEGSKSPSLAAKGKEWLQSLGKKA